MRAPAAFPLDAMQFGVLVISIPRGSSNIAIRAPSRSMAAPPQQTEMQVQDVMGMVAQMLGQFMGGDGGRVLVRGRNPFVILDGDARGQVIPLQMAAPNRAAALPLSGPSSAPAAPATPAPATPATPRTLDTEDAANLTPFEQTVLQKSDRLSTDEATNAIFSSIGGQLEGAVKATKRRKHMKSAEEDVAEPVPKAKQPKAEIPKPAANKMAAKKAGKEMAVKKVGKGKAAAMKPAVVTKASISCEKSRKQIRARLADGTSFSVPFKDFGGEAGAMAEVKRRLKL